MTMAIRAYDLFMAAPQRFGVTPDVMLEMREAAKHAPKFIVDDAAVCFRETLGAKGGRMAATEVPPIAVPFPAFWMEWSWQHDADEPLTHTFRGGALCLAQGKPTRLRIFPFVCARLSDRNVILAEAGRTCFALDLGDDGSVAEVAEGRFGDQSSDLVLFPSAALGIVMFSLALLGAKNVRQVEAQLPRASRRHPGPFSATASDVHYTLDIPGAAQFRRDVESAGAASRKRMHIVRGHFADYTDGGGLFGKLHGRYYIAPHVRGSADRGKVHKDYRVSPPRGAA